jgi:hypothetical protein
LHVAFKKAPALINRWLLQRAIGLPPSRNVTDPDGWDEPVWLGVTVAV